MQTRPTLPAPRPDIDWEDRDFRGEVVDAVMEQHREGKLKLNLRHYRLIEEFLAGKMDEFELSRAIMAPFLH